MPLPRATALLPLLVLPGCVLFGLGGEETDGFSPDGLGTTDSERDVGTDGEVEVSGWSASEAESEALGLEAIGGVGSASVTHVLEAACGTAHTGATAEKDPDTSTVTVTYTTDTSGTTADTCRFRLTYELVGIAPGGWEILAEDDSAVCTVE
jgi:hypothetical protein